MHKQLHVRSENALELKLRPKPLEMLNLAQLPVMSQLYFNQMLIAC